MQLMGWNMHWCKGKHCLVFRCSLRSIIMWEAWASTFYPRHNTLVGTTRLPHKRHWIIKFINIRKHVTNSGSYDRLNNVGVTQDIHLSVHSLQKEPCSLINLLVNHVVCIHIPLFIILFACFPVIVASHQRSFSISAQQATISMESKSYFKKQEHDVKGK